MFPRTFRNTILICMILTGCGAGSWPSLDIGKGKNSSKNFPSDQTQAKNSGVSTGAPDIKVDKPIEGQKTGDNSYTYTVANQRETTQGVTLNSVKVSFFTCQQQDETYQEYVVATRQSPSYYFYPLTKSPLGGVAGIISVKLDGQETEWVDYLPATNEITTRKNGQFSFEYKTGIINKLEYLAELGNNPKLQAAYDKNSEEPVSLALQEGKAVLDAKDFAVGREIEYKYTSGDVATLITLQQEPIPGTVTFSDSSCPGDKIVISGKKVTIDCLANQPKPHLKFKFTDLTLQAFKFGGTFDPAKGTWILKVDGVSIANFRVVGDVIWVDEPLTNGASLAITYQP